MAHLHRRPLLAGPLVTLSDVRCRDASPGCSGEEHAAGHQLIIIRAGVFLRHAATADRTAVVAEPMQALLANRNEPFRVSHPAPGGDDCTVAEYSSAAAVEVLGVLEPGVQERPEAPFRIGHAPVTPAVRLRLHRLRMMAAEPSNQLAVEEGLLGVLALAAGDGYRAQGRRIAARREETRRAQADLVERIRVSLAAAPAEPWSLGSLARRVHSSPFHLSRVFRAATGLPVHQHLLRLRLAQALEELDGGGGELSAIALRAGFASHSHFSTAFRQVFGVRPGSLSRPTAPAWPRSPRASSRWDRGR